MIDTGYLLGNSMPANPSDIVLITMKVPLSLRQRFQAAIKVQGMDMSNVFRQYMNRIIQEVKAQEPEQFNQELEFVKEKDARESEEKRSGKKNPIQARLPESDSSFLMSVGSHKLPKKLSAKAKRDIEEGLKEAREIAATKRKKKEP